MSNRPFQLTIPLYILLAKFEGKSNYQYSNVGCYNNNMLFDLLRLLYIPVYNKIYLDYYFNFYINTSLTHYLLMIFS